MAASTPLPMMRILLFSWFWKGVCHMGVLAPVFGKKGGDHNAFWHLLFLKHLEPKISLVPRQPAGAGRAGNPSEGRRAPYGPSLARGWREVSVKTGFGHVLLRRNVRSLAGRKLR